MRSEPAQPGPYSQGLLPSNEALGIAGADVRERARLHIAIMIGLIEVSGRYFDARSLQELRDEC